MKLDRSITKPQASFAFQIRLNGGRCVKTPPYVLQVEQSDYEEALVPSCTTTFTQTVVDGLVQGTQQGTPNPNTSPVLAGHTPGDLQYYRWW